MNDKVYTDMNMTKLFYFFFSALILNSNAHFTSSQPNATDDSANLSSRKLPPVTFAPEK